MSLLACAGCRVAIAYRAVDRRRAAVGRSLPPGLDAKHAGDFAESCLLGIADLNTSAKQASAL